MVAELSFFTLSVERLDRGIEFYQALFGWQIDECGLVSNTKLGVSLAESGAMDARTAYFTVTDLTESTVKVVELGGKILAEHSPRSGDLAICEDDQGAIFSIRVPAPGFE